MLFECPFQYKRFNPETGLEHNTVDNTKADERSSKRYCNTGKGPWCKVCMHYNQWKVSNIKWKQWYKRMERDKLAPNLWKKVRSEKITGLG